VEVRRAAGHSAAAAPEPSEERGTMRRRIRCTAAAWLACAAAGGLFAEQNIVKNGSLELGPGPEGDDQSKAANWTFFGGTTVERSDQENYQPPGSGHSLKVFGGETTVGAYQDVAASAGDGVEITGWLYTRSSDRIGGDASARIKLEFYDDNNNATGEPIEIVVLDRNSPPDTWTQGTIGPATTPAGTTKVRYTCVWTWSTQSQGSAYWDACEMSINDGGNVLLNGDFEEAGQSGGINPYGIDNWLGFGEQYKSDAIEAWHGDFTGNVRVGGTYGAGYSGLYQDTRDLEAGDRLFWKAYVWNPSEGGLESNSAAALKLEFFPGSGQEQPPPEEYLVFDQDDPVDEWVLVSYETTVPEDITLTRIVLIADDTSTTNGPVYMDASFAERSSDPGVNKLLNASFEEGTSGANGLTDWTEFRGQNCRARKNAFEVPAYDGDSVLKISGSCISGIYQEFEVAPGETLTISTYCYSRSDDPFNDEEGPRAGVKVEWRAGNVPKHVDIGEAPNNTIYSDSARDQWLPIWIDYTMPPGSAALVRCTMIVARNSADSAQVHFDAGEAVVLNRFNGSDVDGDDDEDLIDFYWLQYAFSGDGGTPLKFNGVSFDHDQDQDVDFSDFEFFAPRMTGPK
jgi:hypothetical protein